MDIDARLKALRRLVQSQTDAAKAALSKEMNGVSDALEKYDEYDVLEQNLDILDVIGYRFSERAVSILNGFIQTIESRTLKYSHTTEGFADYVAKYSNAQSLIVKAVEVLVRLRYLETRAVLDVLLRLSDHPVEKIREKALSGLESLAKYDLNVFYGSDRQRGIGPYPQIQILEVLESLDDRFLGSHQEPVLRLLAGLLSPTMEGTRWSSEAMTLSQSATPGECSVADVRRRAIDLLRRLYRLTDTKRGKLAVIGTLNGAARADSRSVVDDKISTMIARDTLEILKFYAELVPEEDLQIVQKIESCSYWIFMHARSGEVKAAARSIEKALTERAEYYIYRVLVGFESVFGDWATLVRSGDYFRDTEKERRETASRFAGEISEANYAEWRERILLYATTESDDLATFPVFYYFLGEFAKARPELALRLITEDTVGIVPFLIPILSNLWDGPQRAATRALIDGWIAHARTGLDNHLFASTKMFLSTRDVDIDLLKQLLSKAAEIKDIPTIRQIVTVSIARYGDADEKLIADLFLPAIDVLTQEKNASWIFEAWYRKEAMELFEKLGAEIDVQVLRNLIVLPKIDFQAEEVLSRIARRAPDSIVDFFCQRIADDSQGREYAGADAFEAIPFGLDKLQEPLSKIPESAVRRVYEQYKADTELLEFRGARLLTNIFPNFSEGFEAALLRLVKEGGETERRFVVGIMRAYQGQPFIHRVCKEIVKAVPEDSPIVNEVAIALETTGVVSGVFGMTEAYERKKQEVLEWLTDPDERVREFAKRYIEDLDKLREVERKRAEEGIALRKHSYGED